MTWLPETVVVHPSRLRGEARVPGSKSYTHRAFIASLLAEGVSKILSPLWSSDTRATLRAVESLGAEARLDNEAVVLDSPGAGGLRWTPCIDAAESGTTMRLITGVVGLLENPVLVYGRGRLHERPVRPLLEAMAQLGVSFIDSRGCCPPHAVKGPARGAGTRVDASQSSQYLSALLLLGAGLGGLEVGVDGLESRPYIDITIRVLEAFGVTVEREGYSWFRVRGTPRPSPYRVPGDWSSGAQLLAVAAAAGGEVKLRGLDPLDPHPDRSITRLLAEMGASCRVGADVECGSPGPGSLGPVEACIADSPDLAPALAAVAATACGSSRICCVERLRLKESDRLAAIIDLAGRAGAEAALTRHDGRLCVTIRGRCGPTRPAEYWSHGDHRVAMAAAALALASTGPSVVRGADSVAKSYPGFWETLRALGARVEQP